MKNIIRVSIFFVPLFIFAVILQSCSSENTVTSPPTSNISTMTKKVDIATFTINHNIDTIITLPKSGVTIRVSKNVPANRIAIIDDYLLTNDTAKTTAPIPQKISPNLRWCPYDTNITWESQNQYKQVPGKYLGIWTNNVDWTKLHDQYGFTNIFADFSSATNALAAHFQHDSIMIV